MRSHQAGFLALRVLAYLSDWKDAWDLARDLQITVDDSKSILKELYRKRLVFKDGHKYIRRWGM